MPIVALLTAASTFIIASLPLAGTSTSSTAFSLGETLFVLGTVLTLVATGFAWAQAWNRNDAD